MADRRPLVQGTTGVTEMPSGDTVPIAAGGTGSTSASAARTALGLEIGTNVQPYDVNLSYFSIISSTGVIAIRDNDGEWVAATLSGLTVTGTDFDVLAVAYGTSSSTACVGNDSRLTNLFFKTISVSGQSDVVADQKDDTLTLAAGTGVAITSDAATDTITVACTLVGVTDGDKGDITVSSTGATWTIDAAAVSYSKIQNVAGLSVFGRSANSSGVGADITAGSDGHILRRSGTSLGFGTVVTAGIADDAVTYAKIQDVSATDRLLGRSTAGAGVIEEITCTSFARTILDDANQATARTTLGVGTGDTPQFVGTTQRVGASSTYGAQPIVLDRQSTYVGNFLTGNDTLHTFTVPSDSLSADGQSLMYEARIVFAANANGKRVRISWGGTVIWDAGTQNQNGGNMTLRMRIVRTGSATQDIYVESVLSASSLYTAGPTFTTASKTLSSSNALLIIANGVADNDVVQQFSQIMWHP